MGELRRGLAGALRLAFLDKAGAALFPDDRAGALRSFWVLLVLLPGVVALDTVDRWMGHPLAPLSGASAPETIVLLARGVPATLLAFAIATFGYLVMVDRILRLQGMGRHFARFVAATNWSSVVTLALLLPLTMLTHSGLISLPLAAAIQVAAFFWTLIYEAYVVRAVLGGGWLTATGFVILDVATTDLVSTLVHGPLTAAG
ncbi:hypothetical protein [Nitrospirillum iridis]|uniref:Yip1 domain-containing protein n=1 Tax=Nitrospirillum iridis TaxID=765888 RepID=A0A7X0AYE1_9PROT|nr:hypothetical protein [Nitrospirillum iridis]MBB6252427.1 hypothetical protein [Nitrospirillum iridis]